jgi:predicted DNA-binding protein YlxM (UPF0122 family)
MAVRDELTAEELIRLHIQDNLSLTKIGEMYGISRQRVHQLKKEYERKHGTITRSVNIDVLTLKHYLDQGWTAKQVAERFDMKASKVTRLIRKYKAEYDEGITFIKIKRKVSKDIISKKELEEYYLVKLYTDQEIAEMFQVSASTVGMLRKSYGIPTIRTKALRKLPTVLTKDKFRKLYLIDGYTLQEIADKFKCNVTAIIELKREYRLNK